MSNIQVIGIIAAIIGIGMFGYLRSEKDEYAERKVSIDSTEAKAALAMIEKLAQSTNSLAQCISLKANPVVQQELIRTSIRLQEADSISLTQAEWTGDYLKIQIQALVDGNKTSVYRFMLEAEAEDRLKILGVQF